MIACEGVSLSYDGLRDAVRGLELHVAQGSIFALVGPNGAGKTSTLRMLATLAEPTAGRICIDGIDAARDKEGVRRRVGYLPDNFALYEQLTPVEYLDFFGRLHQVDDVTRARRIDALLDELDLGGKRVSAIRTLSRGMRQRLGLAKTLMHDPKVLLLDEPASALDPGARGKLREVLLRLKARQLAIVVSSHILPDLAGVADAIGVMEGGRMIRAGAIAELAATARCTYVVEVRGHAERALRVFAELGCVVDVRASAPGRFEVDLDAGSDDVAEAAAALLEALVLRGARVAHFAPRESAIEAAYRHSAASEVS
jgi:ABC-2 type transport system ATP-binding protein